MSEFQLILTIIALGIFVIFFKQLFSGNYPQRGVDFEAKKDNNQIGGISTPTKVFKEPINKQQNRVDQLIQIAQESLEKNDNIEAKKALESLLILEPNNTDALRMLGVAYMNMNNYTKAKEVYNRLLEIDSNDDLAYTLLANAEHKLGEDLEAIKHHKKAIDLDPKYAKHFYNYANTLYDLGELDEAKLYYKKAYSLDATLKEAKDMIQRIDSERN